MSYIEVTSALVLHADPVEPNHAVTKRYVDGKKNAVTAQSFSTGIIPVGRMAALTGDITSAQGSGIATLSVNGAAAGSHPKVTIDSAGRVTVGGALSSNDIPSVPFSKVTTGKPTTAAGYGINNLVSVTGGAVTGPITSTVSPEAGFDAVTKGYVDNAVTAVASGTLSVGDVVRKPVNVAPTGFLRCNGGYADKTLYPDLYNAMGYSLVINSVIDYTSHIAMGAGQPWMQQYDINTTQSSDITGWTTGQSLPSPLSYSQSVVTKDRVYLLGGHNGTGPRNFVYTAQINPDGTIGNWTTGTPLPTALMHTKAVVTKNRIYLLSGYDGSFHTPKVYTATIDTDGVIGSWTESTPLPFVLNQSQVLVTKNRVYLLGGFTNGPVATVLTAPINSDGTIGTWTTGTPLPETFVNAQIAVTKNRAYLFAGVAGGGNSSVVYTAQINADGTLGAWTADTPLPTAINQCETLVTRNRVYVFGGYTTTPIAGYAQTVYTAPINNDGTIGTWATGTELPGKVGYSQVVATNSRVYLFGGVVAGTGPTSTVYVARITGSLSDYSNLYDGSINKFDGSDLVGGYVTEEQTNVMCVQPGAGQPWRQQYDINTAQSTDVTGWSAGTPLPSTIAYSQAIVTDNRAYLLGGFVSGSYSSTVYTATISSDGSLGNWATGTSLPAAVGLSQTVFTKNRVYLLGGRNASSFNSAVYTAAISADGALGTWSATTSLPGALGGSQAIVTKNRVYLLGGVDSFGQVNSVYTASIDSSGVIGSWTSSASLPGTLSNSQAIVTKNRVYLLGGSTSDDTPTSAVYTALVNADGTLGNWVVGTSLPVSVSQAQSLITKNRVYLFGGMVNGSVNSTVYTTAVNDDGTLGAWSVGTSLPEVVSDAQAIVTKNRIYFLGGFNGTQTVSSVHTAVIGGGLSDYSAFYDGTITLPDLSPVSYTMPGSGQPWCQQYAINTSQSGDITGWVTGTALPGTFSYGSAIVTKNKVYAINGGSGSFYVSNISQSGDLGIWSSVVSPLPASLSKSQAIVTKNKVYVIGGTITGNETTGVFFANIDSNGNIGTWDNNNSLNLPSATSNAQAVVTKNRVYLIGGESNMGAGSNILTATIDTNGTLGSWSVSGQLPRNAAYHQIAVTKNRVYLLGGYNGASYVSSIHYCSINADGTLGIWNTAAQSLPTALSFSHVFVSANKVYLIGGYYNGSYLQTAYVAPINSDGSLGIWTTTTPILPTSVGFGQLIALNGKIHILGGLPSTTSVYSATISGGLNDYSPYYDGTIQPIDPNTSFKLPDFTSLETNHINYYIKY